MSLYPFFKLLPEEVYIDLLLKVGLALKAPITTAADDSLEYFLIVFCQRIHMKHQALFFYLFILFFFFFFFEKIKVKKK